MVSVIYLSDSVIMVRDKEKYNEYQQEYKRKKRSQEVKEFEEKIKGVTLEKYPDYIIHKSGKIYSRLTCKKIEPTQRGGYYYPLRQVP